MPRQSLRNLPQLCIFELHTWKTDDKNQNSADERRGQFEWVWDPSHSYSRQAVLLLKLLSTESQTDGDSSASHRYREPYLDLYNNTTDWYNLELNTKIIT